MNKTYQVQLTQQAQEQLRDIVTYISSALKSPEAALHLLTFFEHSIQSLSQFPQRIPILSDSDFIKTPEIIHKMNAKNYFIYFWIEENMQIVHVFAILNSKQKQSFLSKFFPLF